MGPVEWHQTLAAARGRLQLWCGRTGCRPGEHRPDAPPAWATDPITAGYGDRFAAHLEADLSARDE
jgi:hypothetical protein